MKSEPPITIEPPKPTASRFREVLNKFKEPRVFVPTFIGLVVVAIAASIISQYYLAAKKEAGVASSKTFFPFSKLKTEKKVTSGLDGLPYPQTDAERHPLGVMIENHPESRPQYGLIDASVVYEAMAEGGITRFLAIFGPKLPAKVGPVRSARTYYLDWCLEYDCYYAHVGGNIDALDLIPKLGIKDLDQFRYGTKAYGQTYYREARKGISKEHTMMASPTKLYEIAAKNKWTSTGSPKIGYKQEGKASERPASQTINITISSASYNTRWQYDPKTNSYSRFMANQPHNDGQTKEQIKSKVVIVQEVASRPTITRINEQGLILDTVGQGKAKIFQDGQVIEGTWKKAKQTERTIFSDAQGKEVKFVPGQRWITIVNPGSAVTVSQ